MEHVHVMVIEDDPAIRELILETVSEEGYTVVGVESGREALTVITASVPRLILLDRHLGDTDAARLLPALRTRLRLTNTPVVLMSASSTVQAEALELEADGALAKPFTLEELLTCVTSFLSEESQEHRA